MSTHHWLTGLALCTCFWVATIVACVAWFPIVARADKSQCVYSCGPDTGSCNLSTTNSCGSCTFDPVCGGEKRVYKGNVHRGTAPGNSLLEDDSVECYDIFPCVNVTPPLTDHVCMPYYLGGSYLCQATDPPPTCQKCQLGNGTTMTIPMCATSACSEE